MQLKPLVLAMVAGTMPAWAGTQWAEAQLGSANVRVHADHYILRPASGLNREALEFLMADHGLEISKPMGDWFVVRNLDALPIDQLLTRLRADQRVIEVVPDAQMGADGHRLETGDFDPLAHHQWNLDRLQISALHDAGIRGSSEVIVAVLDSGVAYRDALDGSAALHPDLAHTRFVAPADFVDRDPYPDDSHFHGTHVTGVIAADSDNGIGVAGMAPETSIMPVRILDHQGFGKLSDLVRGIDHAVANGADVINLSLSFTPGFDPGSVLQESITRAWSAGVVLVASTGNLGLRAIPFPAAYNEVIAVGATTSNGTVAKYSNFGRGIDVVAPGGDRIDLDGDGYFDGVLSSAILNGDAAETGYGFVAGTSQAAPHVSALAALLMAEGLSDPAEIRTRIERTARGVTHWNPRAGSGLIDPIAALTEEWEAESLQDLPGFNREPTVVPAELLAAFAERLLTDGSFRRYLWNQDGIRQLIHNHGGVFQWLHNNGGMLGDLFNNGGILEWLHNNGGMLGDLFNNGGIIEWLNNNGGMLRDLFNNGGFLGGLNSNGSSLSPI